MNLRRSARPARLGALILAFALTVVIAACGSDDGDSEQERPVGITDQQGNSIQLRTTRDELGEQLGGEEPILTSGPTKETPKGCEYYAMKDRQLINAWQYCFNNRDQVKVIATLYGPGTEKEDVAPARAALIGRGDTICQTENQELEGITKEDGDALSAFGQNESPVNREAVGRLLEQFVDVIESTVERIEVFDAPEEERETFDAYLESLRTQSETLSDARTAFLDGDIKTYDSLGEEFTAIGEQAKEQAEQYGFSICSASTFR